MIFSECKPYSSHGSGEFSYRDFRQIGENVIFEKGVMVFNPQNITIGNNVYVGHKTMLKGYIKNEMIIGDDTWIGQGCFFHSAGNITIGKAVGIGPFVKILTSFHKEEDINLPVLFNPLDFKPVNIRDGADIGIGSIILPGITIGYGVIIGAGAVVTKDIPDYTVAVGNPAKVIRNRK